MKTPILGIIIYLAIIVADFWWEDDALSRNPKKGAYVYRLAFMTKKGGIDNRQNFRRFDETRLTLI